jgi:hypothetical protein
MCEKVLGLYLGLAATLSLQYAWPLEKFRAALAFLSTLRMDMSLPARVAAVNMYCYSVFGYINRHFYMPEELIRTVETEALTFLSRIRFARLRFFSHIGAIYGCSVTLRDLRIANVADLLTTYHGRAETLTILTACLRRQIARRARLRPSAHPVEAYFVAHGYFERCTGQSVESVLDAFRRSLSP